MKKQSYPQKIDFYTGLSTIIKILEITVGIGFFSTILTNDLPFLLNIIEFKSYPHLLIKLLISLFMIEGIYYGARTTAGDLGANNSQHAGGPFRRRMQEMAFSRSPYIPCWEQDHPGNPKRFF